MKRKRKEKEKRKIQKDQGVQSSKKKDYFIRKTKCH